jgi:predicted small secreted protein
MTRPLHLAAVLLAASLAAACHARGGGQGVTATAHEVTVTFHRSPAAPSTVELTVRNGSAAPVCLDASSFSSANFTVKTDKGVVQSITPAPAAADCEVLAPGAVKTQTVDAGQGFSRLDMQVGRVCYRYGFSQSPASASGWKASGVICE